MADLGIEATGKPDVQSQLREAAASLGYGTVAWAREVHGRLGKQHACQRPPPPRAPDAHAGAKRPRPGGELRQLTRLTLVVERVEQLKDLSEMSSLIATYDLVAVVPHTEEVLARCCAQPAVNVIDIISLPMEHRLPYALNPAMLRKAARAGVHFEIRYSHILRDSNTRRHLIANALSLVRAAPVKSLLITSGAEGEAKLRAVEDVAHLATLFHMSVSQARGCLTEHALATIERAELRRMRHGSDVAPPGL